MSDFTANKANDAVTKQPWATVDAARALQETFLSSCGGELKSNVVRMSLFLENERTVAVLAGHVKDRVVDEYRAFRSVAGGLFEGTLALVDDDRLGQILSSLTETETEPSGS